MMEENMCSRGQLVVISGPSGAGKSTVIRGLLSRRPDIHFSVSYTTRQPREGEVNGVNYNFVSRAEFERMIAGDELLEFAEYVGNYYGTSMKVINEQLNCGVDVLLDIEVQGAAKVRRKFPDASYIFLLPPSLEVLAQRLRKRNTDSEEVILGRLERAKVECEQCVNYDYIVVNDIVEEAVDELCSIMKAESCRTKNRAHITESYLGK